MIAINTLFYKYYQGNIAKGILVPVLFNPTPIYRFECDFCCVGDSCNSFKESGIRGGSNSQCLVLPRTLAIF